MRKPKTITAIFIDSDNKTVTEIEIENTLEAMYKQIGNNCDIVQTVTTPTPFNDLLWVDEEGRIRQSGPQNMFAMTGLFGVMYGNAIVTSSNRVGDITSAKSTLQQITDLVVFPKSITKTISGNW